jgi:glycosyltransferase involved in cell wall biosynthesis
MITIFTPSAADEANTNAQNLSVKEIVARFDPDRAAVTMIHEGAVDPRIASRPNTTLLRFRARGNTLRAVWHILKNPPDVYFFPREGPLDAAFLSLRRRLRLKTALVTYVVSGGLYNQTYSSARERNIREADSVFANNTYLAQLLKEKMDIDAGIVYDGVDRRYFFPPELPRAGRNPVSVLCAGSFRSYKRMPLVIREAARWPQARFRIAGTGEEEDSCKRLAVELGCKNIDFLGHLSPTALGEEMRRADIFFFPSVIEGHPQVVLQAAASGLPVIAMNIYRPDYVVNSKTGFLVETDSELSEKLGLLLQQANLRRSMGEGAISHARKYDWDIVAREWLAAFEQAIAKRRKH